MNNRRQSLVGGQININNLLAFIFGLIFVSAILYFSLTVVNPNPLQIWTFKTVLALAAGGIAAVLPGYFEFRHLRVIRAGGGLAVFAAVFFAPISIVQPVTKLRTPADDGTSVVQSWFKAVDSGDYQGAWKQADPATAQWYNIDLQNFLETFQNVRTPLGKVVSRKVTSKSDHANPPNLPPGIYRSIIYLSKYEKSPQCIQEGIVLRATEDLRWRVFSHQISFAQMPCL